MRQTIFTLLLACTWSLLCYAQTPYDSFAPQAYRPMLELEMPANMQPDTIFSVVVADLENRMLLLMNVHNGEILAAISLSDDVSKWLSVDPLSDKYPGVSPYAYCNWNPVKNVDSEGMEWTDIDGNVIKDHTNIKAYIFYNRKEFGKQTEAMYSRLEKQFGKGSVAISDVTTTKDFQQDWQDMASTNIAEVNLNYHGNNQTIMLDASNNEYITATGNGLTNKSSTPAINVQYLPKPSGIISRARLNLNTCRSNSTTQYPLKGSGKTLMQVFYDTFGFQSVRGTSSGVSYNRITSEPEPQYFWQSWDYLTKPSYQYKSHHIGLPPK